ncbi:MAG: hypothetical protein JKY03_10170 [Aureispira sp.]|nr:hypothetical protein [Aureispira sp.]
MKDFDTIIDFRTAVSKRILYSSAGLLFVGLASIPGFVADIELTPFLALLAPINALYMGTVFRYVGGSIEDALSAKEEAKALPKEKLEKINNVGGIIFYLIPIHFILIAGLIVAKAWFSLVNFQEMCAAFAFIEAFFGSYMGMLVFPIFGMQQSK